jgi:post-segregation antitoxin (ccd killing protein)
MGIKLIMSNHKSVIKIDEDLAEKGRRAGLNLRVVAEEAIKNKTKKLEENNGTT